MCDICGLHYTDLSRKYVLLLCVPEVNMRAQIVKVFIGVCVCTNVREFAWLCIRVRVYLHEQVCKRVWVCMSGCMCMSLIEHAMIQEFKIYIYIPYYFNMNFNFPADLCNYTYIWNWSKLPHGLKFICQTFNEKLDRNKNIVTSFMPDICHTWHVHKVTNNALKCLSICPQWLLNRYISALIIYRCPSE